MAVDERRRHELHDAARRTFGEGAAVTVMEMLPPVGWADVATKRDLENLCTLFDARLAQLDLSLRTEMARLETRLVRWVVGAGVAVVAATGVIGRF